MARRIVSLLLNDSGIGGQLAQCMTPREAPKPPVAPPLVKDSPGTKAKRVRKSRKLSPHVVAFLHDRRDLAMPSLLAEVQQRFGVTLSSGSVYKAWKMPRAA